MGALAAYLTGLLVALAGREDETGFDPGGHDDEASVSSALALVEALVPFSPDLARPLAGLRGLRAALAAGEALTPEERAFIGATLAGLERALAG